MMFHRKGADLKSASANRPTGRRIGGAYRVLHISLIYSGLVRFLAVTRSYEQSAANACGGRGVWPVNIVAVRVFERRFGSIVETTKYSVQE